MAGRSLFVKLAYSSFLIFLALSSWNNRLWALSSDDLVIIFNGNSADSRAVANYYAAKRGVPKSNLLAVDVTSSERMSRTDFDKNLIPPVRNLVHKLKGEGRTPALLLVYGIPLIVGNSGADMPGKELLSIEENKLDNKVNECRQLVLKITRELDAITLEPNTAASRPETPQETSSTQELLKMAGESLQRGSDYLNQLQKSGGDEEKRKKVYSLLISLAGTNPHAQALAQRFSQGGNHDQGLQQNQEFLKLHALMGLKSEQGYFWGISPEKAQETANSTRFLKGLMGELNFWEQRKRSATQTKESVAVDSELSLILVDYYPQARWLPNPFQAQYDKVPFIAEFRTWTLMVCRLDGPTPAIAKRLVDDALTVEKSGLQGILYIDARGLKGKDEFGDYPWYDQHLVNLYRIVKERSSMKVVIDQNPQLFPPGACPNAALYCGWYSLGKYIDSFKWQKGAVGYHVASSEATTLKKPGSTVWCKRMLEEGVAATLGPVAEPYLMSFPLPDQFFPLLMTGKLPLVEVYFRSLPLVSWRMILIGDPLYTPFKKNPAIQSIDPKDLEIVPARES
jgi:uncharacterized protein (TIGR03790 family)